jgi:ubiquinone/menaquinone biosynthesis C-methylase UbiE
MAVNGSEQPTEDAVRAGQAAYSRALLAVYDVGVLWFSNRFLWRCPSRHMRALYDRHAGARHLDVGVGTGSFLDHCRFPVEQPSITLLDLNPNSLGAAAKRIERYAPRTAQGNVLEPVDLGDSRFDSVGLNFLLHCLPGTIESKAAVFRNLKPYVEPGGVFFGSTVLTGGVRHTWLSRRVNAFYNRKGIFSNEADSLDGLRRVLEEELGSHELEVRGSVALFSGVVR